MRYLIEGRVIPERVDLSAPKIEIQLHTKGDIGIPCAFEIIKSKIFIHLTTPPEVSIPDIRNSMFTAVGTIVNYACYRHVIGVSYELDSITEIDQQITQVFGTEGCVFQDNDEFGDRITFPTHDFGAPLAIDPRIFLHPAMTRVTFEIRNSIRYPDYTALHCRLAIEAIRNSFDPEDRSNGWRLLRENLKVSRDTIDSFKDVANNQRHGKNQNQTWQQRQRCMQIAWEICWRFEQYLMQGSQSPLADRPTL